MINKLNLSFEAIPPVVLWGIFGIFVLIYGVITAVLFYHWREYGMKAAWVAKLEFLYLLVSFGLLAIAFSVLVFFI